MSLTVSASNNVYAQLQSLLQKGPKLNGSAASSADPIATLLSADRKPDSSSSAGAGSAGSATQFDPDTLSTLLSLQIPPVDASCAQASDGGGTTDVSAWGSGGDDSSSNDATNQVNVNSDGSTTTTVTYADGSTVTTTAPALSSAAGSALDQLMRLQAQLMAPATAPIVTV